MAPEREKQVKEVMAHNKLHKRREAAKHIMMHHGSEIQQRTAHRMNEFLT